MNWISQALILLSFSAIFGMAQTMTSCTVKRTKIGRMPTTFNNAPTNTSQLSGLFLNTDYSSPCNGTVIAWDFCYYISVTQASDITIQAGVWRADMDGNYTLVDDSLIDLPIPPPQPGFQFVCRHWTLGCREPTFDVQEGDIVGMYVNDTSDDNMVHILGMPPNNESSAGTMKSVDVTNINSVSNLTSVSYSLYLEAVLDDSSETTMPECPTITTESGLLIPLWAIAVICVLGAIVLVLIIIIIVAIICYLSRLNRTKGSGPVLITRLNHRNNAANKGPASTNRAKHEITETELNGNSENTNHKLSQQKVRPRQALLQPPLLNVAKSPVPPAQGEATSPSGNTTPPVVFTIAIDDDQQPNGDEVTLKPTLRKISLTNAQKIALLPKLDLRRSHSAAEAMNLSNDDLFTSSSEYPYVVHSFVEVEKDRSYVGSLPNMLQYAQNYSSELKFGLDNLCDETTNTDVAPYASIIVDDSDADFHDDEPTYSYTDRRELLQNDTNNIITLSDKDISNQDYHYDEYRSDWTHAAQLELELTKPTLEPNSNIYDDCQSPDYQDIDEYEEIDESTLTNAQSESSNQVSPLMQSSVKENSTLPLKSNPKPPIQPRKKLPQIIMSSNQPTQSSKSGAGQNCVDKADDKVDLNAQTPNKYMKLLSSTKNDSSTYTYLMQWRQ